MLLDDVVVVADSNYWLTGRVCVLLGQNLLRVHMKTQIPIIATRCINICPTRLKHDHYDGPALSLHARAPPSRAARAPSRCRGDSLAIPGPARPGRVRTRAGSRARDELLSSRLRPGPRVAVEIQSRVDCETGRVRTDGDRAAQDWPDPVRADIPDNNVMVSSLSRHLAIMSSLARTRPKPSTRTSL